MTYSPPFPSHLPTHQTSNSELIFRLSRQTNNPFHLDLNTGVLSVQNTLDREANPDPYEVQPIIACNHPWQV